MVTFQLRAANEVCAFLGRAGGPLHPDPQHEGRPTAHLVTGDHHANGAYDILHALALLLAPPLGVDLDEVNYSYGKILSYPAGQGAVGWHRDDAAANGEFLVAAGRLQRWQLAEMTGRRMSLMIQLSPGRGYSGGDLQVRDADGEVHTAPRNIGTAVAIRSDTEHQVLPVTRGTRVSLVCFFGTSPRGEEPRA